MKNKRQPYKYNLHTLLRKLPYADYQVAMSWLPEKLRVTRGTFQNWIYIRSDSHHQIPAAALLLLADFFGCAPKDIYTVPPTDSIGDEFTAHKENLLNHENDERE